MPAIDPGKLTERVIIQSVPTAKSSTGADIRGTPVRIARAWASITFGTGSKTEFFAGEKLAVRTIYSVEMAYIPNLTEDMEVIWESRGVTLNIIQVQDLGRHYLSVKLLCQEQR